MFERFVQSFGAFNVNSINNIIYNFMSNWWLIFLVIAAVVSAVLSFRESMETVVREEQNIL